MHLRYNQWLYCSAHTVVYCEWLPVQDGFKRKMYNLEFGLFIQVSVTFQV